METIIQSSVEVSVNPSGSATFATAPRLVGQPVVSEVLDPGVTGKLRPEIRDTQTGDLLPAEKAKTLSFMLSAAETPLRPTDSYLTFLFDTRTPEEYEGISLNLDFRVNQLEYNIVNVDAAGGIGQYQASSWLTFVLPIDGAGTDADAKARHRIGEMPVVIPLRTYPVPPSLVSQQILADPDSLERLEDIREWDYEFTYAHPDIAQDAIGSSIRFNLPATSENDAVRRDRNRRLRLPCLRPWWERRRWNGRSARTRQCPARRARQQRQARANCGTRYRSQPGHCA